MKHTHTYKVGDKVTIRPEWRDAGDGDTLYFVATPEGFGRLDIAPVEWAHGAIRPLSLVAVAMIQPA